MTLAAALWLLPPSPASAQVISFGPGTNIAVGSNPQWIATGDFNADGRVDLAVANAGSASVSVLLGNGDGTFQAPQNFTVAGVGPSSVVAADFNNDGVLDLVTTNGNIGPSSDNVSVLIGNGNGTFQPALVFPSGGTKPNFGAVGDFNGDGARDLAVATFNNGSGTTFTVLLGNGNGTFQTPITLTAQTSPIWVAVGDANGDSSADVLSANFRTDTPGSVSVLLGNGNGTFQAAQNFAGGPAGTSGPAAVALGHFNGDGILDVAVPNYGASGSGTTVSVLLGTGGGAFGAPQAYTTGRSPIAVAIADFDRDGSQDLAVANFDQNSGTTFSVLRGNGGGTFLPQQLFSAGQGVIAVAVADFNDDDSPDVAVANYASGNITIRLNTTSAPPASHTLTVAKAGAGSGTITSSPAGINCGADCSESYTAGTIVTLTATPAGGSTFAGWSGGGCSGTGSCVVTMTAATTVTATFNVQAPQTFPLNVSKSGAGSGTVTSSPAGISCGGDCSESYNSGTVVTLTAAPAGGSTFAGWSGGGCSGTGSCQVTMTAATTVTATFDVQAPQTFPLNVSKSGAGSGTVTSSPAGISCGADCSESYDSGTVVTLTAAPAGGSTFAGWSGACSGTGSCQVTMTAARSVSATFNTQQFALSVAKGGGGNGTVTSSPAGINCGSDCSESYDSGTAVSLTATPAAGSTFTGWSGACSGTGACNVTMTAARSVTATFALQQFTLTVTKGGLGLGTVGSSPAGINCGTLCSSQSASFTYGTVVTLSATPALSPLSAFDGWSGGACSGTGPCTITITGNTSVTASFRLLGLF
jgi:hypothetical protein